MNLLRSYRYTTFIGIAIEIPFALGEMLLGLEAYYIRDWRTLQMVAYLPLLALLVLWFLVPESPRWSWNNDLIVGMWDDSPGFFSRFC